MKSRRNQIDIHQSQVPVRRGHIWLKQITLNNGLGVYDRTLTSYRTVPGDPDTTSSINYATLYDPDLQTGGFFGLKQEVIDVADRGWKGYMLHYTLGVTAAMRTAGFDTGGQNPAPFHPNLITTETMTQAMIDSLDDFIAFIRLRGLQPWIYANAAVIALNPAGTGTSGMTPLNISSRSVATHTNEQAVIDYFVEWAEWCADRGVGLGLDAFVLPQADAPDRAVKILRAIRSSAKSRRTPLLCENWPVIDDATKRGEDIQFHCGSVGLANSRTEFTDAARYDATGAYAPNGAVSQLWRQTRAGAGGWVFMNGSGYTLSDCQTGSALAKTRGIYLLGNARMNLPAIYDAA